jgi:hypothetical protein
MSAQTGSPVVWHDATSEKDQKRTVFLQKTEKKCPTTLKLTGKMGKSIIHSITSPIEF